MSHRLQSYAVRCLFLTLTCCAQFLFAAPPDDPFAPTPSDGDSEILVTVDLSWSETDSDGDIQSRELRYGTTSGSLDQSVSPSTNSYQLSGLLANTTYYWQIVLTDAANNTTPGPEWSFTTTANDNMTNLVSWYRPEELGQEYTISGEPVDVWRDVLGTHTLSEATVGDQPLYRPSLTHGKAGLEFKDEDRLFGSYDHNLTSTPLTVAVVYAQKSIDTFNTVVMGRTSTNSDDLSLGARSGTSNYDVYIDNTNILAGGTPATFEANRFVIQTYRYDGSGGNHDYRINGEPSGTLSGYSNAAGRICLGEVINNIEADAYVSELLIYDRRLEDNELNDLEVYLADKYGLYHKDAKWISENYDEDFREVIKASGYKKDEADELYIEHLINGYSETWLIGLKSWYRPEELGQEYTTSGEPVDVWRDVLGTHTLSEATVGDQPLYRPSLSHGKAGLEFKDEDRFFGSYDHNLTSTPLTIAVVYAQKSIDTFNTVVMGLTSTNSDDLSLGARSGTSNYDVYIDRTNRLTGGTPATFEANRFVIQTYRYDGSGGNHDYRINGEASGTLSGFSNAAGIIGLGEVITNIEAEAYVSELLIYDQRLEDTALNDLEVYLADKYGLYHPRATWVLGLDPTSQATITAGMLTRDEFLSSNGAYASDAPWLQSYSLEHQAYIIENELDLADVSLWPGSLESTFGLENGLILFMPLADGSDEISGQSWSITEEGTVNFNNPNRFNIPNSAPDFDTNDSFFEVKGAQGQSGPNPLNAMTVSLWTKTFNGNNNQNILFASYDGNSSNGDDTFRLRVNDGPQRFQFIIFHQDVYDDDGDGDISEIRSKGSAFSYIGDDLFGSSEWRNVVGRYDPNKVSSNVETIVDLQTGDIAADYNSTINSSPNEPVGIGAATDDNRHYKGLMNDIMVWDRALSDEELELLYFIQLDPATSATFEGLISGVPVTPSIESLSYNGTTLSDGDSITFDATWSANFNVSISLDSVEFLLGDGSGGFSSAGFFQLVGSTYEFNLTTPVQAGLREVKVVATNGVFSDEYVVEVNFPGNQAPSFAPLPSDQVVLEGATLDITLSGTDPDSGQSLSFVLGSGNPAGVTIDSQTGLLSWTPGEADGGATFPVTVSITDNGVAPLSTEAVFQVRVVEVLEEGSLDTALETALRAALGLNPGDLMTEDALATLSVALDLSGLGIEDLSGVENLTGITDLDLSDNLISDLTPITGLSGLNTLDLSNNRLDFDPGDPDDVIVTNLSTTITVTTGLQARYAIDVAVVGPGIVTKVPDQPDYGYDDQVTLTAQLVDVNDFFAGWTGTILSSSNMITRDVYSNEAFVAKFIDGVPEGNGDGLVIDGYRINPSDSLQTLEESFTGTGYRQNFVKNSLNDGVVSFKVDPGDLDEVDPVDPEGDEDFYSYSLKGKLEAQYTDEYFFFGNAADEMIVRIYGNAGELLLEYEADDGEQPNGPISLTAGERYSLEILYRELDDNFQFFTVQWRNTVIGPTSMQTIPQRQLYSGTTYSAFASPITATYYESNGVTEIDELNGLEYGRGSFPEEGGVVELSVEAGSTDTIRYTLDESNPTAALEVYQGPISISGSAVLKAQAFGDSKEPGAPFLGVFTTDLLPPVLVALELPNEVDSDPNKIAVGSADEEISILVEDNTDNVRSLAFTLTEDLGSGAFGPASYLGIDETPEPTGVTGTTGQQYRFSVPFDIFDFDDSTSWILSVEAIDGVGNVTTADYNVTIEITDPPAPTITQPGVNDNFSSGQIFVSGTARKDSTVSIEWRTSDSSDGLNPSAWQLENVTFNVSDNGEFTATLSLDDNQQGQRYEIRATAISRSGMTGLPSTEVPFIVDSNVPAAPTNLLVSAIAGGLIEINWTPASGYNGVITGYRIQVQDIDTDWNDIAEVSADTYTYILDPDDLNNPVLSAPYNFRVLAFRSLSGGQEATSIGSESPTFLLENVDDQAPTVDLLSHAPSQLTKYDSVNKKYGPGFIEITLETSEPISGTPYLAFLPTVGLPLRVDLFAIDDQRFEGTLAVDEGTPAGQYTAYLKMSDLAGNISETGSANEPYDLSDMSISINDTFELDSEGPTLTNLSPDNRTVFNNDGVTPITYQFEFNEALDPDATITPTAEWGDEVSVDTAAIALSDLGSGLFEISITLNPGEGYDGSAPDPDPAIDQLNINDATLYITIGAVDTLGNLAANQIPGFLVYRNQLPGPQPTQLTGQSIAGGGIKLIWEDVDDADAYEIWRQDLPGALATIPRGAGSPYEFIHTPTNEGDYIFYVLGLREVQSGVYIEGFDSNTLTITSDSTAPPAVTSVNVSEEVPGSVVRIDWVEPTSPNVSDIDHYKVYRTLFTLEQPNLAAVLAGDQIGLDIEPTEALIVYDSQPLAQAVLYTVVTFDLSGNATISTQSPDLNIALVPPAELTVSLKDGVQPLLSWSDVTEADSYSVYYLDNDGTTLINLVSGLTTSSYTDTSWFSGERRYLVESVKDNPASTASREIVFPGNAFDLAEGVAIYRGLPARISIERESPGDASWTNYNRRVGVATVLAPSENDFVWGDTSIDYVPFGLEIDTSASPPAEQAIIARLELRPNSGFHLDDRIIYDISRTIPIEDLTPYLSLSANDFTRGTTATDIEITVSNPSESAIQLALTDETTPSITLKLLDLDNNLLAQETVTALSDRTIEGLSSTTLGSISFDVPETAPASVILQAELNSYKVSVTDQSFDLSAQPVVSRLAVITAPLSYQASITGFTLDGVDYPQSVSDLKMTDSEPLIIKGKALALGGALPSVASTVIFGIENGDYKRTFSLITDSNGEFAYTFSPAGSEPGGTYTVWAKHPEITNIPDDPAKTGQFIYQRTTTTPEYYTVRLPRNYERTLSLELTWSDGLSLADVEITPVDFNGNALSVTELANLGVELDLSPANIATPELHPTYQSVSGGDQQITLLPTIKGIETDGQSSDEVNLLLQVKARVDGDATVTTVGGVPIYSFFTSAFGELTGPSDEIELGVILDSAVDPDAYTDDSATITFTNTGLIPLTGLTFEIFEQDIATLEYRTAPDWAKLSVPELNFLDLNESITLQFETRMSEFPASEGDYVLEVVARSNEGSESNAVIKTKVSENADSTFKVEVVNIFLGYNPSTVTGVDTTGVDVPSDYINGVAGATITLQRDDVVGSTWTEPQIFTGVTAIPEDGNASYTFGTDQTEPLSPGRYQIKITAPKHEPYYGTILIRPGITHFEQIPLNYGAVSVEWEVREITIEDRYEVNIETTFETTVPAPILLITPAAIELPAMCPGDVYEVELLVENKGILAAQDFKNPTPESDAFLRVEPITNLPDTFDVPAQDSVRVAFRYICLQALPNSECAE
ncbi:MAG: LamG-like jellyroll fold domain-containing protein [Verrucomicrobiota bacterium]